MNQTRTATETLIVKNVEVPNGAETIENTTPFLIEETYGPMILGKPFVTLTVSRPDGFPVSRIRTDSYGFVEIARY